MAILLSVVLFNSIQFDIEEQFSCLGHFEGMGAKCLRVTAELELLLVIGGACPDQGRPHHNHQQPAEGRNAVNTLSAHYIGVVNLPGEA